MRIFQAHNNAASIEAALSSFKERFLILLLVQVNWMRQLVKCAEFIQCMKYKFVIFIDDLDRVREEKVSLSSTLGAGTYF